MKVRVSWATLLALAVASLTASMAYGKVPDGNHSAGKSAKFEIVETMHIPGGPTLKPGTYKLALLNNSSASEVAFYQASKLVGQAPVKLVNENKKADETEVFSNAQNDGRVLVEIDPSGWTERLMFQAPGTGGGPGM
jgi:hypothetical protein